MYFPGPKLRAIPECGQGIEVIHVGQPQQPPNAHQVQVTIRVVRDGVAVVGLEALHSGSPDIVPAAICKPDLESLLGHG